MKDKIGNEVQEECSGLQAFVKDETDKVNRRG